ncbi:MAG: hypothetical protein ABIP89_22210, partial [Polyangiaceae bacterium]
STPPWFLTPPGSLTPRSDVAGYYGTTGISPDLMEGGANGGFRAGDSFPESPMKHSTNVQSQHLPMRAWEGTLERYKKAVVILPTIWESDMNTGLLYGPWQQQGLDSSLSAVGGLILNPMQTDQGVAKRSIQSEVLGQVSTGISIVAHVGDRPVGMQEYGGSHRFSPHVVVLTYDEAIRMIQLSAAKNGEAFPYTYTSAPALGGSYTLYLQVEQLPN